MTIEDKEVTWSHEGGLAQVCLEEVGGTEREPRAETTPEPEEAPQTTTPPTQTVVREYRGFHNYGDSWFGPARKA